MACQQNTTMECNCTYSCPRHGKCCDCLAYHTRNGEFPACFFSKEAEASYDRSLARLLKDRGK
ncbi:MAG: DUF6485 family protein [Oscillospiraceae bacterium]|nr:DUF6485 family protein [Oscillospiraceae bacterium]